MTDIEKKALALVNEVFKERGLTLDGSTNRTSNSYHEALCRAIERIEELEATEHDCQGCGYAKPLMELQEKHEAFRREVSDALVEVRDTTTYEVHPKLWRFILPKPDPLVEAIREMALTDATPEDADRLRAALAARGLEIREVE